MAENYICAVDIGSSKIAASLATLKKKQIQDIFLESLPSQGIKRGAIVDSIELMNVISRVLKNLKYRSGVKIKSVHAIISGGDLVTKHSRAIIPLTERGNKVITSHDIAKVNEQALILGSTIEEEAIHQIPYSYSVDNKSEISNPLGLYGHKLEVDLYLICGRLAYIQTLSHVINQAGYEAKELCFSGLAASEVVFNPEFRKGLNIICDIGSEMTELLLFKDGLLKDIQFLPFGGNDLTVALSEALDIPWDLAEDIKVSHGIIGDIAEIKEDKQVLVKKDNLYKPIKQKLVSEIITIKAKSLCQDIKAAVEKIAYLSEINNFIFTGRTMLQEGLLEMLENQFGIMVEFGRILQPELATFLNKKEALSGHKYLTYLSGLGLIAKELYADPAKAITGPRAARHPLLQVINKLQELYQEYF